MALTKGAREALGCLFIFGALLTAILVPLGFSYVEYYQYGLKKRRSSGSIDLDRVYSSGRYNTGVRHKFIHYQADSHFIHLEALEVFSAGGTNESVGLDFKLDFDCTYLLIEEEVGLLHKELASSYENVVTSRARDAIKNEAIFVTFTEYFEKRKEVEARFREAVQKRWNDKPSLHVNLDQFHLGRIRIPESVVSKQLESRVQNEKNQKESFDQQAQFERELTSVEVNSIDLESDNVLRNARAQANLLRAKANVDADRIKAEAQLNGTQRLFEAAGITLQEHKTAFTYLRTLKNRDEIDLDVSYLTSDNIIRTKNV